MKQSAIFLIFFLFTMIPSAVGNVVLPSIFTDNMVLQQKSNVRIWGWAKALEHVHLKASWMDNAIETVADNKAQWSMIIETPSAGGPYAIEIQGYNKIVLENVMIGEVWLCAGQSNMEWTARMGFDNAEKEVSIANFPNVRLFTVNHRTSETPQWDVSAEPWKICTPETMRDFSGVAYFFGRKLHEELQVPIGLINVSWGGTPAEAWTALDYCEEKELILSTSAVLDEMPWGPEEAGLIYNAMVAPLIQYRIAGTIWYQGETHAENLPYNPTMYAKVFPILINSWREAWGYSFPFYFVQIAPFQGYTGDRGVNVRDAQRRSLAVENTAMVVTSDIGDIHNLHPGNKKDVGLRLARIAFNRIYGDNSAIDSGPLYSSHEIMDGKIRIQFEFAEGLHYTGKELTGFEIAGKDKIFYPASAELEGETVVIHSSKVPEPVHARFAWSNDAVPVLCNEAKLPTSSFTTVVSD